MLYESTRGGINSITSAHAIKNGIAHDGGLFVPDSITKLDQEAMKKFTSMTYKEIALEILKIYLSDYSEEELIHCVDNAYSANKFGGEHIAPLSKLDENIYVLELWHGPTCAFKDFALQMLPHLLTKATRKTGEKNDIVILVATSGDTGKAALEGFKDVSSTKVIVFYPKDGVSEIQKLQMITQEGSNVFSIGVEGNFDDAQNGVKELFADFEFNKQLDENGYMFSSANSINWGRLVPQIVYYFVAYSNLVKNHEIKFGDKINFVVPTGNFGNILAGFYAKQMGLPINKLICASNENSVISDFINTGIYNKNRELIKTTSPSMDILISSNLERLLYELTNHNSDIIRQWMSQLKEVGSYIVDDKIKKMISDIFWADSSNDADASKTIECIYKEYNYLIDTHTAVAIDVYDKYVMCTGDVTKAVILSTASPFKFNETVAKSIFNNDEVKGKNEFELLELLSSKCNLEVPINLRGLDRKDTIHNVICARAEMRDCVKGILRV